MKETLKLLLFLGAFLLLIISLKSGFADNETYVVSNTTLMAGSTLNLTLAEGSILNINISDSDRAFIFELLFIVVALIILMTGIITHSYVTTFTGAMFSIVIGCLWLLTDITYIPALFKEGIGIILVLMPIPALLIAALNMFGGKILTKPEQ
jgi:hypothetical protein